MRAYAQNVFLLAIISSTLMACDRQDVPRDHSKEKIENDNTEKNVRDRDSMTKTPLD